MVNVFLYGTVDIEQQFIEFYDEQINDETIFEEFIENVDSPD